MKRALIVAAVQITLLLGIWAKYQYERTTLPRAWVRSAPFDPYLPLRGRYVSLRLLLDESRPEHTRHMRGHLTVRDGQLVLVPDEKGRVGAWQGAQGLMLDQPVLYFIPDDAKDPSQVKPGEELWVEVSVPPEGPPRPVRLEVRQK